MEGVVKTLELKPGDEKILGEARLTAYTFRTVDNPLHNMRSMRDDNGLMMMYDGDYARLVVAGELVMSDTQMEKNSNRDFITEAKGDVFIGGLGIGLILHNLREKVESGVVRSITVMEISQDVIDLISPYYSDLPITYVCDDVVDYLPPKDEKYDTIYFDIWPSISTENLPEIAKLHNRWKYRKRKGGWMGSWMQKYLQAEKKKEDREYRWW